jgi:hypothetical protein
MDDPTSDAEIVKCTVSADAGQDVSRREAISALGQFLGTVCRGGWALSQEYLKGKTMQESGKGGKRVAEAVETFSRGAVHVAEANNINQEALGAWIENLQKASCLPEKYRQTVIDQVIKSAPPEIELEVSNFIAIYESLKLDGFQAGLSETSSVDVDMTSR